MKTLMLALAILAVTGLKAQGYCRLTLYHASAEVNAPGGEKIKNIRRIYRGFRFLIKGCDNVKRTLPDSQVWGYGIRHEIYRNYNHEFYKVEKMGPQIRYTREMTGFRGRPILQYYTSATLDSPLRLIKTPV